MKMEQTDYSETSAHKIKKLENRPIERIQHSEHGESLKEHFSLSWILSQLELEKEAGDYAYMYIVVTVGQLWPDLDHIYRS